MAEITENAQSWWTDERIKAWERLDKAAREVRISYDDDGLLGGLSLHARGPNPNGVVSDMTPDEWFVTLPYDEDRVDVETVSSLLSTELDRSVEVVSRGDEWEPGYWLLVENWGDSE